ncbi:MAG: AI-2E family transporter [Bacteroidetes bacterium]|nr:AI-2E family transporter [Bacteroidota bacterium]
MAALWFLRAVVAYFLVAAIVTFLGSPLVNKMESRIRLGKRRMPRTLATILVLLLFLTIFLVLIRVIAPPLIEQISAISHISYDDFQKSFGKPIADLREYAVSIGISAEYFTAAYFKQQFLSWVSVIDFGTLFSRFISGLSSFMGWIFSVLFISFFFLKEKFLLYRIIHILTPDKHEPKVQRVMRSVNTMLGRYFRSILLQILVFGTYIFIGLTIFGEKYALTIAVFSGIINLISYIGPLLGVTFALLFSICSHIGADFYTQIVPEMSHVAIVYVIAIALDNFISYPLIFSNSLRVHPLELFSVILIGFRLGGLGGMIVAAPVYTVLRIIAREFFIRFEIVKSITRRM